MFQKLGVEIEFLTFKTLVNEYIKQWKGKDDNYIRRANFWLMSFNDIPVKSIKAEHVEKILSKYAAGETEGYGPTKPKSNNTLV